MEGLSCQVCNITPSRSVEKPTSGTTSSVSRAKSIVEGLKELKQMHESGILSDEEFHAAKRKLLGL
jgi:hypothetical protein|tara:strand:- start:437 stop:634 length:198 start_codon:yes stop_codon:yes gene_type:complete